MRSFATVHQIPSEGRTYIKVHDEWFYEFASLLTMNLVKNPLDAADPILDSIKILGATPDEDVIEVFV